MFERHVKRVTVTIANGAALSGAFDFRPFKSGGFHMPATWTAAAVGFHVSTTQAGTFLPLKDGAGNPIQVATVAVSEAYALPSALEGFPWVKLWSQNGAGVGVNQGGDRIIGLNLKS